jgi:hypothetical protein
VPSFVIAACLLAGLPDHVEQGGGRVEIAWRGESAIDAAALAEWVDTAARAVSGYFGRFPVPRARLTVELGGRGGVGGGVTHGGPNPTIRIHVGSRARTSDLERDWVLTHEMVHLAFPDLTTDDAWAEEGLATYVEPIARARIGAVPVDSVWSDLVSGLPQGQPDPGDPGLHATEEWGRTYWGGAQFWLRADVRIREKTKNRLGLPDALRAILEKGGDIRADWSLKRALAAGDGAVGLTVLGDLYAEMAARPGAVDLDELWARLGVRRARGTVAYDDGAPLADVRRAIVPAPR